MGDELARRAAEIRARTRVKLPDAFVLATALDAENRGLPGVALESFDRPMIAAHAELRGP